MVEVGRRDVDTFVVVDVDGRRVVVVDVAD